MSLDARLTARAVVWNNVLDGLVHNINKPMFDKDYVIEKKYLIEPSNGYAKVDLSGYKVRSILDMSSTRYDDYRSSSVATETTEESYKITEYSLHGRMLVIKTDAVAFNLRIRFVGCEIDKIKNDLENELKCLYLSLIETTTTDIYNSINRVSDSFKNTVAEISQNVEVKRKPYSQVKLNRL